MAKAVLDDALGAEAMLFGRGSYEFLAALRVLVYPVVLGAGERLFAETSAERPLRLVGTVAGDEVAFLTYECVKA